MIEVSLLSIVLRLVIKPGTERNEMERNETKWKRGGLWCKTSGPDEARKTAGRQARHRVHFSWTQSNAEGVWILYLCQYVAKRLGDLIFGDVALSVIGLGGAKNGSEKGHGIATRRFHRKT